MTGRARKFRRELAVGSRDASSLRRAALAPSTNAEALFAGLDGYRRKVVALTRAELAYAEKPTAANKRALDAKRRAVSDANYRLGEAGHREHVAAVRAALHHRNGLYLRMAARADDEHAEAADSWLAAFVDAAVSRGVDDPAALDAIALGKIQGALAMHAAARELAGVATDDERRLLTTRATAARTDVLTGFAMQAASDAARPPAPWPQWQPPPPPPAPPPADEEQASDEPDDGDAPADDESERSAVDEAEPNARGTFRGSGDGEWRGTVHPTASPPQPAPSDDGWTRVRVPIAGTTEHRDVEIPPGWCVTIVADEAKVTDERGLPSSVRQIPGRAVWERRQKALAAAPEIVAAAERAAAEAPPRAPRPGESGWAPQSAPRSAPFDPRSDPGIRGPRR